MGVRLGLAGGRDNAHRCQVDMSTVGIDLKIPTRLPGVAIYIPSPNLLTCRCLQHKGNHLFRLSWKSTEPKKRKKSIMAHPRGSIHSRRERDTRLKCQHLPRPPSIHQPHRLRVQFPKAGFLVSRRDARCRSERLIQPLPDE